MFDYGTIQSNAERYQCSTKILCRPFGKQTGSKKRRNARANTTNGRLEHSKTTIIFEETTSASGFFIEYLQ